MSKYLRITCSCLLTLLCGACAFFLYLLCNSPAFEAGESYTFYLGKSSSAQAVFSETPSLDKLLLSEVQGESAVYSGNVYEQLKTRYRAKLLFTEEAAGVINYYLFSPLLGSGVELGGKIVNLHVAVSAEQTAAGTPVIFGGF